MKKLGQNITDKEIKDILNKHDKSGDQAISLEEFKLMIIDMY